MALLPRKNPRLSDMVGYLPPRHDQPCKRIAYSSAKSLFEMLKNEASDG